MIASSGRSCSSWKLELHSTSRLSASHSTKASGMVSMASRRRMSAATVFSTRFFCSVMSTAMPIRCGPGSPRLAHQLAARAQPHPMAVGVAHAEGVVDGGRLGVGKFGRQLIEPHVIGMHQRADVAECEQVVLGLQAENVEHRLRPEDAAARQVPVPQAAASAIERGVDAAAHGLIDHVGFARPRRLPMEGEAEDEHDEAGGGRQGDGEGGERAPG